MKLTFNFIFTYGTPTADLCQAYLKVNISFIFAGREFSRPTLTRTFAGRRSVPSPHWRAEL